MYQNNKLSVRKSKWYIYNIWSYGANNTSKINKPDVILSVKVSLI